MKHTLLYIALPFLLGGMIACDTIDEDNRYIEVEDIKEPSQRIQRVLIEEFTGRMCVNCPDGAKAIHDIQEYYEGRVVAVSIHAGMYAMPVGLFTTDYRTEAGTAYNEYFAPQGNPAAMLNRNAHDGLVVSTIKDKWMTYAIAELDAEPLIEITPSCSYDADTRTVTITTDIEAFESMPANLNLQLQLTESNIVDLQLSQTGIINDYVHNHVLRAAINGTWGENLVSLPAGDTYTYTHTFTLDEAWVAENCHVVAYAFDNTTKSVLQCNECAVVTTENE